MTTTDPVAALAVGTALLGHTFTYTYATSPTYDPYFSANALAFQPYTTTQQAMLDTALATLGEYVNVSFVETTGAANFTFGRGFVQVPGQSATVAYSEFDSIPSGITVSTALSDASTLHFGLHELGHGLGLGHADTLDPVQQTTTFTLMVAVQTAAMPTQSFFQVDDLIALCSLYGSAQHIAPADYVAGRLYIAAFGRAPDPAGLQWQIQALHDGLTPLQLATNFWNSPEAQVLFAGSNVGDTITKVYEHVLGREPEWAGLNYQAQAIYDGMSWGQLLLNFANSAENVSRHVDYLWS